MQSQHLHRMWVSSVLSLFDHSHLLSSPDAIPCSRELLARARSGLSRANIIRRCADREQPIGVIQWPEQGSGRAQACVAMAWRPTKADGCISWGPGWPPGELRSAGALACRQCQQDCRCIEWPHMFALDPFTVRPGAPRRQYEPDWSPTYGLARRVGDRSDARLRRRSRPLKEPGGQGHGRLRPQPLVRGRRWPGSW